MPVQPQVRGDICAVSLTRITGSADMMAGRAAEGLLPGSLATNRPPAWGLNSVSAVGSHTLATFVAQAQWNPGQPCTLQHCFDTHTEMPSVEHTRMPPSLQAYQEDLTLSVMAGKQCEDTCCVCHAAQQAKPQRPLACPKY